MTPIFFYMAELGHSQQKFWLNKLKKEVSRDIRDAIVVVNDFAVNVKMPFVTVPSNEVKAVSSSISLFFCDDFYNDFHYLNKASFCRSKYMAFCTHFLRTDYERWQHHRFMLIRKISEFSFDEIIVSSEHYLLNTLIGNRAIDIFNIEEFEKYIKEIEKNVAKNS